MYWRRVLGFTIGMTLLVLLYQFDPENGGFPACLFRSITGLLCPGCGSQRALHDLLHGHIAEAFSHNALMVLTLPLLGMQSATGHFMKLARPVTAYNAVVFAWAALIIGWGVLRNVW